MPLFSTYSTVPQNRYSSPGGIELHRKVSISHTVTFNFSVCNPLMKVGYEAPISMPFV